MIEKFDVMSEHRGGLVSGCGGTVACFDLTRECGAGFRLIWVIFVSRWTILEDDSSHFWPLSRPSEK